MYDADDVQTHCFAHSKPVLPIVIRVTISAPPQEIGAFPLVASNALKAASLASMVTGNPATGMGMARLTTVKLRCADDSESGEEERPWNENPLGVLWDLADWRAGGGGTTTTTTTTESNVSGNETDLFGDAMGNEEIQAAKVAVIGSDFERSSYAAATLNPIVIFVLFPAFAAVVTFIRHRVLPPILSLFRVHFEQDHRVGTPASPSGRPKGWMESWTDMSATSLMFLGLLALTPATMASAVSVLVKSVGNPVKRAARKSAIATVIVSALVIIPVANVIIFYQIFAKGKFDAVFITKRLRGQTEKAPPVGKLESDSDDDGDDEGAEGGDDEGHAALHGQRKRGILASLRRALRWIISPCGTWIHDIGGGGDNCPGDVGARLASNPLALHGRLPAGQFQRWLLPHDFARWGAPLFAAQTGTGGWDDSHPRFVAQSTLAKRAHASRDKRSSLAKMFDAIHRRVRFVNFAWLLVEVFFLVASALIVEAASSKTNFTLCIAMSGVRASLALLHLLWLLFALPLNSRLEFSQAVVMALLETVLCGFQVLFLMGVDAGETADVISNIADAANIVFSAVTLIRLVLEIIEAARGRRRGMVARPAVTEAAVKQAMGIGGFASPDAPLLSLLDDEKEMKRKRRKQQEEDDWKFYRDRNLVQGRSLMTRDEWLEMRRKNEKGGGAENDGSDAAALSKRSSSSTSSGKSSSSSSPGGRHRHNPHLQPLSHRLGKAIPEPPQPPKLSMLQQLSAAFSALTGKSAEAEVSAASSTLRQARHRSTEAVEADEFSQRTKGATFDNPLDHFGAPPVPYRHIYTTPPLDAAAGKSLNPPPPPGSSTTTPSVHEEEGSPPNGSAASTRLPAPMWSWQTTNWVDPPRPPPGLERPPPRLEQTSTSSPAKNHGTAPTHSTAVVVAAQLMKKHGSDLEHDDDNFGIAPTTRNSSSRNGDGTNHKSSSSGSHACGRSAAPAPSVDSSVIPKPKERRRRGDDHTTPQPPHRNPLSWALEHLDVYDEPRNWLTQSLTSQQQQQRQPEMKAAADDVAGRSMVSQKAANNEARRAPPASDSVDVFSSSASSPTTGRAKAAEEAGAMSVTTTTVATAASPRWSSSTVRLHLSDSSDDDLNSRHHALLTQPGLLVPDAAATVVDVGAAAAFERRRPPVVALSPAGNQESRLLPRPHVVGTRASVLLESTDDDDDL